MPSPPNPYQLEARRLAAENTLLSKKVDSLEARLDLSKLKDKGKGTEDDKMRAENKILREQLQAALKERDELVSTGWWIGEGEGSSGFDLICDVG
ncbi:hypothetical protein K458DRAFT_386749 [Lentithecium fluviatile CBS 122367]|uniref:Uncharacterized protein n=1 Tax=Lentithecium fluviatile CBS 122367 TaxID=1168545 RepID=A0A6G1J9E6_9PLEO|nr:hypothetical protein K458DRAFT_386749 [Lentithecium fluviatile CBS 122367]